MDLAPLAPQYWGVMMSKSPERGIARSGDLGGKWVSPMSV
ncbi:hypothetical protein LYNGBM3L_45370 [Moorena producens 3L]|uniref:Uncharacterized protein n=1 Tax=Moorena producens 3L TaxID=489825 RepID=F4XWU0_9CYAN|nr:hypothetical protein LYNGBM3L_45370 [Moorena producens 3L]